MLGEELDVYVVELGILEIDSFVAERNRSAMY